MKSFFRRRVRRKNTLRGASVESSATGGRPRRRAQRGPFGGKGVSLFRQSRRGGEHKAPRRGFFVGFCSCYSQPGGASSSGTVGSVSVPPPTSALPPVSVLPSVPSPPSEGGRTGSSPPPGSVSVPPSVPPLGGMPASGRPAVPTRMIWLRLL